MILKPIELYKFIFLNKQEPLQEGGMSERGKQSFWGGSSLEKMQMKLNRLKNDKYFRKKISLQKK